MQQIQQARGVTRILGVTRVRTALAGLVHSARRELLSFDDPVRQDGEGAPEPFLRLAGQGDTAGCRSASRPALVRRIAPRHVLSQLREAGRCPVETRVTDSIPFSIIVADRAVAAVPLDLDLHDNGVLLIRDPVLVQALVRTHQAWWEAGDDPSRQPRPPGAPAHLRPVLEAILAGLTDDAAAARLNMSGRTYSRRVGELMNVLGTSSRFRAGVEAARRGWV
ncbi:DNA-binding response regulator [Streptomyces sp. NPDC020412]|uniref:DNA-binding response regulator n=1 Tax=Streptomyces sp. NPDC020412 TaxID=3365073 RepID=UPI0037A169C8